jgi:hypothetical protein
MNNRLKMKRNILIVALISISIVGCCKIKQNKDLHNAVNLNSSEYKLLLNPATFGDYNDGFEKYWSIIKEVAAEQNIPIIESEKPLKQSHKNIGFFDTKDMDLRKNGYMLRRKIKFNNNVRKPGVEFSLKFRSTNPEIANTADVKIGDGFTPKYDEIELESDIVYYSVKNGVTETTYSVQNVIELDENPKSTIGEFAKIYPVLSTLDIPLDEELKLIADTEPVEYMVRPGKLDFGDGLYGRMDMTIWLVELGGKQVRIPEFSFDHPFDKDNEYNPEAMERCILFINKLQEKNPDWVIPGKLKAAYLFDFAAQNKQWK